MKIEDWYLDAIDHNEESLILLIDFLVYEKKVLHMEDDESKLEHYFQERFRNSMNAYLYEYQQKLKGEQHATTKSS
ncbi:hypothetical protein ACWE42_14690 [Sutcliffiella cohnii]